MVEVEIRKEDDVIEVKEESENTTEKEAKISQKVVLIPRHPPLFSQRLMKKTEDDKLKSKWTGTFLLTKVLPHGVVELANSDGTKFMVNGQRIKVYVGNAESVQEGVEAYHLDEV
ncbi:uncharacterized protein LOC125809112 [Solanum verrucosum]|uniref:uncharacterized protein LOC125809112 n=1 Tax=Solanum verrucosum TaxID=315347 RepID=UPI0020D1A723|nr:uncharacterized protein LOC125809112 [Solanum verrucosum]